MFEGPGLSPQLISAKIFISLAHPILCRWRELCHLHPEQTFALGLWRRAQLMQEQVSCSAGAAQQGTAIPVLRALSAVGGHRQAPSLGLAGVTGGTGCCAFLGALEEVDPGDVLTVPAIIFREQQARKPPQYSRLDITLYPSSFSAHRPLKPCQK